MRPAKAGELFRSHVPQRADHVAGLAERLVLDRFGETEIGDTDDALRVQQQIGGLDVFFPIPGPCQSRVLPE